MSFSVTGIKGLDQLNANVNALIKTETSAKTKLLLQQAQLVKARIIEKAPLGPTGTLKKSGYAVAYPETTTECAVAFAGIRPRKAPHAHLVEFGHGGPHPAPPHPFVRPAWDELHDQVTANIAKGMGDVIQGAV